MFNRVAEVSDLGRPVIAAFDRDHGFAAGPVDAKTACRCRAADVATVDRRRSAEVMLNGPAFAQDRDAAREGVRGSLQSAHRLRSTQRARTAALMAPMSSKQSDSSKVAANFVSRSQTRNLNQLLAEAIANQAAQLSVKGQRLTVELRLSPAPSFRPSC